MFNNCPNATKKVITQSDNQQNSDTRTVPPGVLEFGIFPTYSIKNESKPTISKRHRDDPQKNHDIADEHSFVYQLMNW